MINLAARDIAHGFGRYLLTSFGLGLLIGVTLTMAGVFRGMIDDAQVLLNSTGADIWVVQKDTLGPYAESSVLHEDVYRAITGLSGVEETGNVTYLPMQVQQGERDVRVMIAGFEPGHPGEPTFLVAGRPITRSHYEAIADIQTGFKLNDKIRIRRNEYTVVGLTRRMVSSGGDPMVFINLKDAQGAQFLKDNDAI
jgi:putative ABC transport system permease protein